MGIVLDYCVEWLALETDWDLFVIFEVAPKYCICTLCWLWGQESSRKNIYFCFIDYAKLFDSVDHNKLWKILQEMGIPDHLTCLLRNLYAGQEATVCNEHGTTDRLQIRKGVCQGCILSPCLFNFISQNTSWKMLDWMKHKLESSFLGEISINLDLQMAQSLCRKWRWTKEPLDESEKGEWKSWLKTQLTENWDHGIWSHHFMANRWGNSGNSDRLYFGASKSLQMVTAAMKIKDACFLEEKLWHT